MPTMTEPTESLCIRDAKGQALANVYFEDEKGRRTVMPHARRSPSDCDQHRQSCLTYCVDNGESRARASAQYSVGHEGPSALIEPTPVGIVADARPLTRSVNAENSRGYPQAAAPLSEINASDRGR
jgi:hypothetical protein